MLVDLQTSSIFSAPLTFFPFFLSPVLFLSPGPVSPYKRLPVQRRKPGLRHSTQLLLISVHSEGKKCAYLHAHAQICLDTESPVRSGMVCVRSWSVIQSKQGSKKGKIVSASFQVIFHSLQSLSESTSAIPTYVLVGVNLCVELFIIPSMLTNYKNVPISPLLCKWCSLKNKKK